MSSRMSLTLDDRRGFLILLRPRVELLVEPMLSNHPRIYRTADRYVTDGAFMAGLIPQSLTILLIHETKKPDTFPLVPVDGEVRLERCRNHGRSICISRRPSPSPAALVDPTPDPKGQPGVSSGRSLVQAGTDGRTLPWSYLPQQPPSVDPSPAWCAESEIRQSQSAMINR